MSLDYNSVIIAGRLTDHPAKRTTTTGKAVCSFTVAVNNYDKTTSFIPCVAWEKKADFVEKYFRKGSAIFVQGAWKQRSYEDNSGQKRRVDEVVASEVKFVESKSAAAEEGVIAVPAAASAPAPDYENVYDDGDLPF